MKYHISPKTGRPNQCRAQKTCPYGDLEKDHYDSADAARAAYEDSMKEQEVAPSQKKTLTRAENYYKIRNDAIEKTAEIENAIAMLQPTLTFASESQEELLGQMRLLESKYRKETNGNARAQLKTELGILNEELTGHQEQVHEVEAEISKYRGIIATQRAARIAAERVIHKEQLQDPHADRVTVTVQDLTRNHAIQIARTAAAHNSGETVLEVRESGDGAVDLRLSSWPRAKEAKDAFEAKGFLATMAPNNNGQWLRVRPMPKNVVPSSKLAWHGEESVFTAEASELGNRIPQFIKSQKSDKVMEMRVPVAERDAEGEILYWESIPVDPSEIWKVRIYND